MKAVDQKAVTIRTEEIADTITRAAASLREGNFGIAYSHLFQVQRELDKITFEVVRELGAIEERTK